MPTTQTYQEPIFQCVDCGHLAAIFQPAKNGFACAHCHRISGAHIKSRRLSPAEIKKLDREFQAARCSYCKHPSCQNCGRKGSRIR